MGAPSAAPRDGPDPVRRPRPRRPVTLFPTTRHPCAGPCGVRVAGSLTDSMPSVALRGAHRVGRRDAGLNRAFAWLRCRRPMNFPPRATSRTPGGAREPQPEHVGEAVDGLRGERALAPEEPAQDAGATEAA
jgi:hypothetical protein